MSSGGGGTNTVTQNAAPPQAFLDAYTKLINSAQGQATQPLQQYSGQMVAGFTPDQIAAMKTVENVQGVAQPYINAGADALSAATSPLWSGVNQIDPALLQGAGTNAVGLATQAGGTNIGAAGAPGVSMATAGANTDIAGSGQAGITAANQAAATNIGAAGAGGITAANQAATTDIGAAGAGGITAANRAAGADIFRAGLPGITAAQRSAATDIAGAGMPGTSMAASGAARGITAANAAAATDPSAVSAYFDPYLASAVGATQAEFNNQNQQTNQGIISNAISKGAWGGDRAGVAQAIAAGQEALAQAPVIAGMESQGYQSAQQALAQQEALRASTALSGANISSNTGLGIAGLGQAAAGQRAGLETSAALQGAGLAQQAVGQRAALQAGTALQGAGLAQSAAGQRAGLEASTALQGAGLAQSAAGQQAGLEASTALQGAGLTQQATGQQAALQTNAGLGIAGLGQTAAGQQAGLQDQAAQLLFNQFSGQQGAQLGANEANAWLNSQAGFGLANLGQEAQSTTLAGAQALMGTGGLQQSLAQEQLNVPFSQFQQQQAYPFQTLNWLGGLTAGLGGAAGGTSSTTSPNPSVLSQLTGLGLSGAGIIGGTGGFGSSGWLTGALGLGGAGAATLGSLGSLGAASGLGDAGALALATIKRGGVVQAPKRADGGGILIPFPHTRYRSNGGGIVPANDDRAPYDEPLRATGSIGAGIVPHFAAGGLATMGGGPAVRGIVAPHLDSSIFAKPTVAAGAASADGTPFFMNPLPQYRPTGTTTSSDKDGNVSISFPHTTTALPKGITDTLAPPPPPPVATEAPKSDTGDLSPEEIQNALNRSNNMARDSRGGSVHRAGGGIVPRFDDGGDVPVYGGPGQAMPSGMPDAPDDYDSPAAFPVDAAPAGTTLGVERPPREGGLVRDVPVGPAPEEQNAGDSGATITATGRGIAAGPPAPPPPAGAAAPSAQQTAGAGIVKPDYSVSYQPRTGSGAAASDMKLAPWLALTEAGLAIAGGKSPNALANIGQGGLQGVKAYTDLRKQANAQQEKENEAIDTGNYRRGSLDLQAQHFSDVIADTRQQLKQTGEYQTGELSLRQQQEQESARHNRATEGTQRELAEQGRYSAQPVKDAMGNEIGVNKLNTKTGELEFVPNAGTSAGASSAGDLSKTGDDYLKTLDPSIASSVKGLAEGTIQPPTSFAASKPYWQMMIQRAQQYDPDFDMTVYRSRADTRSKFANGPQGNTVRSLSVATSHLDTLDKLATALNNGDTKLFNQVSNAFKDQFGTTAPNNFNTAKQIVGDEVVKAVVGAGGAQADREKAQAIINAANSPAQLHEAIQTYKDLMKGQLNGLQQQFVTGMEPAGRPERVVKAKELFLSKLTPEARAALAPPDASPSSALPGNAADLSSLSDEEVLRRLKLRP